MAIMNTKEATSFKDQKEKLSTFLEIASTEKQLLASMYSKGLLHKDVNELYHKARSSYENIILNDYEVAGLQEVEYSLWKLHYKHIDEYRKQIRQSNAQKRRSEASEEDTNSLHDIDRYMEGFKSFLTEATHFYQNLVKKLGENCGLPGELLLRKKGAASLALAEPVKFPQCQYACHRFLVCLGDLARYSELCKMHDARDWSPSAAYYLEASRVWPDSGNPHNQLALLATYTGDAFLALYHCVRSLAVKEPFPDAWNNLILLFEENRSSHIHSLSSEALLDLLNPSGKTSLRASSCGSDGSSNGIKLEGAASVSSGKSDLWSLFVRLTSFFLLKPSLEDFSYTLASMVRQLEALMELGDELKAALESYQFMDPSRNGPYRTLQLVTILIFIIHCLTESSEGHLQKEDNSPESYLTKLALTATFVCTGRIVERCLKGGGSEECPLLPTVLVFVEWLVNTLGRAEAHATTDERVTSAMSYFFGAFVDLLNRLDLSNEEVASDNTALWEDHELKGFDPMAHAHMRLDFRAKREHLDNKSRSWRMFLAATKQSGRSGDLTNWILYDNLRKRFKTSVSKSPEPQELNQQNSGNANEQRESENLPSFNSHSITTEEEEVILFEPIGRHNSVPVYTSSEGVMNERVTSDECLRRASSLSVRQDETQVVDTTNFYFVNPLKPPEPAYPDGPPSLKAWVMDGEFPHPHFATESFNAISINETGNPIVGSSNFASPAPSAPFLPEDDASWFKPNKEGDGILGAPPTSGYTTCTTNWPATRGPFDFVRGYSQQGMSSSEWLYHYRNRHSFDQGNHHIWPSHFNAPIFYGNPNAANVTRLDPSYQWGYPLVSASGGLYLDSPQFLPSPIVSGADENRRDKLLLGCQRREQPTLQHYLKESEVGLQPNSQFRGPTFMGN